MSKCRFAMAVGLGIIRVLVEKHSSLMHGLYPAVNIFSDSDSLYLIHIYPGLLPFRSQ